MINMKTIIDQCKNSSLAQSAGELRSWKVMINKRQLRTAVLVLHFHIDQSTLTLKTVCL